MHSAAGCFGTTHWSVVLAAGDDESASSREALEKLCRAYWRPSTTVTRAQLKNDNQKFVSAIGFVDGHAAQHDFTKALTVNAAYPIEPTANWVWYNLKSKSGVR
jgi:hypothetical protein